MADDQQNPFTMAGMMGMMMPNPYTAYKGQALPMPGYMGTPTDAQGNPIKSFTDAQAAHDAWQPPAAAPTQTPGTTLNSSSGGNPFANVNIPRGQNAAVSQPRGGLNTADWNALTPAQRSAAQGPMSQYASGLAMMPSGNNFVASGSNPSGSNPQASNALAWMNAGGSNFDQMANQGQQQAPAPTSTNPVDMRQAYLTALSNPGKVTTPGATVPQAPPLGQPSVMDSFLAAHPSGGGAGAGNYNNTGFFDTLNKLRSA